jgi:excisionase family DNA binding protein
MSPLRTTTIERLMTVKTVAEILQVSTKTVLRRIASGDLITVRDGRLLRVRLSDLDHYIATRRL